MSPKKGVRANRKITEKTRTVRKEKSQLNKPANLKVSIPLKTSAEKEGIHVPIIKGRRPPIFTKKLDVSTKVELANIVARQQLVKEEQPVFQLDNVVFIKNPKPRGRKKNVQVTSDFQNRIVTENNNAEDIVTRTVQKTQEKTPKKAPPQKKPPARRILTRKRLADTKTQAAKETVTEPLDAKIKSEDTSQDSAFDETVNPECDPVVEPQVTVVDKPQVTAREPIVEQSEPEVKPPAGRKTKSTLKLPQPARKIARQSLQLRKRGRPKGKQQNIQSDTNQPSIIDLLRKKSLEAEVTTKQTQQNTPGLVDSRKNSVGSGSNKSWTRDISSSSNCTVSACSNDFVRIDKKLPVLKLTHIDNEVKKRQNEARETVAIVDETDEGADSYDSDSSDSNRKFPENFNDTLRANSRHLSSSSSSQFTQPGRKEASTDHEKAADKLRLTMEKLDMEIINWMSSDNEDVNANLLKFKDKMFDILDNEFGVITHCRRLKEILEPPRKEDIIDEISISEPVHNHNANKEIEKETLANEKDPVSKNTPIHKNTPAVEINNQISESSPVKETPKEPEKGFVIPRLPSRKLSASSDSNISNASSNFSRDQTSDNEVQADTNNYYDHHDDDDALSLFAESISGFESSRMNTSVVSAIPYKPRPVEEYVPKSVKEGAPEKHVYCPTRIREEAEVPPSKTTPDSEKQNVDSTLKYKQSNSTDDAESFQDYTENIDLDTRLGPPDLVKKPCLMDSYFEGLPKSRTRSVVFGNLCFYNLMNCCRKVFFGQCRFMHMIPTSTQIKDKLNLLDERMLIQEYLLLRNWSELRRKYGMCYVEECAKRGLTRILVEIAYDFIVKARSDSEEDTRLRVDTIEITLLHLNSVDLSVCEDLLKLPIHSDQGNRTLLCDVLMATMSITQNFSRFKVVFLTLTYFMVNNDRTFNKDVVEHILERVCILPFEEAVTRALIQMMRLTNADIFNNSMIVHFEKQISVNKDVFEEYTLMKNQCVFSSMLASSVMSASPLRVDTMAARSDDASPARRDASPDTISPKKTAEEPSKPVITRTIGMNPPIIFNRASLTSMDSSPGTSRSHVNPGTSRSHDSPGPSRAHVTPGPSRSQVNTGLDTSDDSVQVNVKKWRNRSIFPHILPPQMVNRPPCMPARGAMRPPMRPQMRPPQRLPFNQRLVTFKSPTNYVSRQSGPKY